MLKRAASIGLVIATWFVAGCIGENEAVVFVEPSVEAPSVSVESGVLGATVSGVFTLKLVLGPRASGSSTVQIGAVDIRDAANEQSIVSGLSLSASPAFPVTVQPDSEVSVDIAYDLGGATVPVEKRDAICAGTGVRIAGAIEDSLQAGTTPFASAVFQPTGCM